MIIYYFLIVVYVVSASNDLRQDRFDYSIPFVTQGQFYQTNFLVSYDATERCPSKAAVINSLRSLSDTGADIFAEIIRSIEKEPDDYDVIRTYSSEILVEKQKFYCYVNQQLCLDNRAVISKLMPFIRRATNQINYHSLSSDFVVYRGMKLTISQRSYFKKGAIFRFPGFTSTTKSKFKAQFFGDTMLEIHVFAQCLQVRDIASISYYPYEDEYLFSPYSLFEVTDSHDNVIILKAIDNLDKTDL